MKNKEKYILNEIVIETADTLSGHKVEIFYKGKIIYERIYLVETSPKKIADFFNWLEEEYKPPFLMMLKRRIYQRLSNRLEIELNILQNIFIRQKKNIC